MNYKRKQINILTRSETYFHIIQKYCPTKKQNNRLKFLIIKIEYLKNFRDHSKTSSTLKSEKSRFKGKPR